MKYNSNYPHGSSESDFDERDITFGGCLFVTDEIICKYHDTCPLRDGQQICTVDTDCDDYSEN